MTLSTEAIQEYIVDNFDLDDDEVASDSPLFSSGLLDSLTMMELITYVESECGFKFRALDVNLGNLDTIDSLLQYIKSRT